MGWRLRPASSDFRASMTTLEKASGESLLQEVTTTERDVRLAVGTRNAPPA